MAACSCVLFGNLTLRNRSGSFNKKSVLSPTHVAGHESQLALLMPGGGVLHGYTAQHNDA
jgi:hypothetical protein